MPAASTVHLDHPDARIVQLGNLLAVEWRGTVRSEHVDRVGEIVRATHDTLPAGLGIVMVIREGAPVPAPLVRERIKTTIGAISDRLLGHATIIEGSGIGASTVRTAINAMRVFIRQKHPEKAFGDAPSALAWLRQTMDGAATWTIAEATELLRPAG